MIWMSSLGGCAAESTDLSRETQSGDASDKAEVTDRCSCACAEVLDCTLDCGVTGLVESDLRAGTDLLKAHLSSEGDKLIDIIDDDVIESILSGDPARAGRRLNTQKDIAEFVIPPPQQSVMEDNMSACWRSSFALGLWGAQQLIQAATLINIPIDPAKTAATIHLTPGSLDGIGKAYVTFRKSKSLGHFGSFLGQLGSHTASAGVLFKSLANGVQSMSFAEQARALVILGGSFVVLSNPSSSAYKVYKLTQALVQAADVATNLSNTLRCSYDTWQTGYN